MQFLFQVATQRAHQFHIEGVTYSLTMGVVKNIIPAIASTNAIISAGCVAECIKLLSYGSQVLNNNAMFQGNSGLYQLVSSYDKLKGCPVCDPQSKWVF